MFAQIIRGKTFDPWAVRPLVDRWMKELAPGAIGWLGTTSGVTDDNQLFVLVRFESEEDARANSDRPEQGEWWAEMESLFEEAPTFQDSGEVFVETRGDLNSAEFVQVRTGEFTDRDRVRKIMIDSLPARTADRPDILGTVNVGYARRCGHLDLLHVRRGGTRGRTQGAVTRGEGGTGGDAVTVRRATGVPEPPDALAGLPGLRPQRGRCLR